MASTTNYGWSTPDDSAYVKDGASAIRTLGSAIDTSVKSLNAGTTAGDLDYYTSATSKTRIAIGSTNQVLTVTGGVPTWQNAASAFEPILTPENVGSYVRGNSGGSTQALTANQTYYLPIFLPTFSADRISIRTSGTSGSSGNIRLGLYNSSITTGKPTTVVFDAGTVAITAALNTNYEITISQNISAGYYYLALNGSAASSLTASSASNFFSDVSTTINGSKISGYTETGITGAFATAGTLTAITGNLPNVSLRIA
jgi:hypothetical protein